MRRVSNYLQFWKIYLDTCCLSRLVDELSQDRILREAEAVQTILEYFKTGRWYWIASEVLKDEVSQNPDEARRFSVQYYLNDVHQNVLIEAPQMLRGQQLEALGFKHDDALHIACAESGNADVLLTTDDKFLRRARHQADKLYVRVENPYTWLQESPGNEHLQDDRTGDL